MVEEPGLAARVAELEALLDQEVASREYWQRAHASLERRCSALSRDTDRLGKLLRSEVCAHPLLPSETRARPARFLCCASLTGPMGHGSFTPPKSYALLLRDCA